MMGPEEKKTESVEEKMSGPALAERELPERGLLERELAERNLPERNGSRKPLIGVLPLVDEGKESYWMLPGYMKGIEEAGGLPVMLPLTEEEAAIAQLAEAFDGFVFTGGPDVSPWVYGEEKLDICGDCTEARDRMESRLLPLVLAADKPVLGICRGIQILNAVLGGTLYQDHPTQHPSKVNHRMAAPYDRAEHGVQIVPETPLAKILRQEKIGVNSCHHQAIKDLSEKLNPMAAAEDGLIEAVYMPDKKFVVAVQWHPEFSYKVDENSRKIFRAFVEAAEEAKD